MTGDKPVFDFDSKRTRDMVKRMIENARGKWTWELKRLRDQRSLNQNAYLWSCIYPTVAAGIREAWGETYFTVEDAHEFCRAKFLSMPVVDRRTGVSRGRVIRSTASLDKAEFAAYVDKIIVFAAEMLGVEIPEAEKNRTAA